MKTVEKEIGSILAGTISSITQRSIFNRLGPLATTPVQQLTASGPATIMTELENSVRLFARRNSVAAHRLVRPRALRPGRRRAARRGAASQLAARSAHRRPGAGRRKKRCPSSRRRTSPPPASRPGPRRCASASPSSPRSRWRPRSRSWRATSSSTPARAPSSCARSRTTSGAGPADHRLDQGPGIAAAKLEEIWAGTYKSQRGMGKGLVAVKKLVDEFQPRHRPGPRHHRDVHVPGER